MGFINFLFVYQFLFKLCIMVSEVILHLNDFKQDGRFLKKTQILIDF